MNRLIGAGIMLLFYIGDAGARRRYALLDEHYGNP